MRKIRQISIRAVLKMVLAAIVVGLMISAPARAHVPRPKDGTDVAPYSQVLRTATRIALDERASKGGLPESALSARVVDSEPPDSAPQEWSSFLPLVRHSFYWAGLGRWTPWAFLGEGVSALKAGPQDGQLWAIVSDGLHVSTNLGRFWQRADHGLPIVPRHIAVESGSTVDPAVYTSSWWGQIYVSHDRGATWTLEVDLQMYLGFLDFADGVLYAGNRAPPYQVLQRVGPGQWEALGGEVGGFANDIAMFGDTLYLATSAGLYRLVSDAWESVTVDQYALAYESVATWIPSDLMPNEQMTVEPSAASPRVHSLLSHGGTLFVSTSEPRGLYRSGDGLAFYPCDVGITDPHALGGHKIVASETGRLFAATTTDGVFVSDDQGDRWQILDEGLPHSKTAYGRILDDVRATALAVVRDRDGQQTLGAVFNGVGLWMLTITDESLMVDGPPQSPPKAVLVVGPIDPPGHSATRSYIDWSERLALVMEHNGMDVIRVYWPHSTWENVRAAISGASIVVYKGHGFGLGDIPADPTEMYGGLNGFCLVHPDDPLGARLGTQDMLVTTSRLAENALAFFFCCSCAGSAQDAAPVSDALARRRIEAYSSTVLRMGGRGYFSGTNEEAILHELFANPEKTLGEIYQSVEGQPGYSYPHVAWPDLSVWFGESPWGWGKAFVGDPSLTLRDILGW